MESDKRQAAAERRRLASDALNAFYAAADLTLRCAIGTALIASGAEIPCALPGGAPALSPIGQPNTYRLTQADGGIRVLRLPVVQSVVPSNDGCQ